jgi:hypothetical protein
MTVTFTPNIDLAKPDKDEDAKDWVLNSVDHSEDNNDKFNTAAQLPISTYTVTLKAETTNPNIGNTGTTFGRYTVIRGWVLGFFIIRINGTGITNGTGIYGVNLPTNADSSFHSIATGLSVNAGDQHVVGEGFLRDVSSVTTSGTCAMDLATHSSATHVRFLLESYVGKTSRLFNDGDPFSLADGDRLTGNFFYKQA